MIIDRKGIWCKPRLTFTKGDVVMITTPYDGNLTLTVNVGTYLCGSILNPDLAYIETQIGIILVNIDGMKRMVREAKR